MDEKIRSAYEAIEPTPEQEERMLAALLKAQEALEAQQEPETQNLQTAESTEGMRAAEAQASGTQALGAQASGAKASDAQVAHEPTAGKPTEKRARFSAWKIALPLAACLAFGAIVVGVTSSNNASPAMEQSSKAATSTEQHLNAQSNTQADGAATPMASESEVEIIDDGTQGYVMPDDGQEPFNTEEYAAVKESGFISTRTQPLSTVSADVDTASYANLRRMLNDGKSLSSIPEGAVRIEEMLNYFTYDYAKPENGQLFNVQAQASTCPWNPDTQLLVLGFATPRETAPARDGANLVFLIDVSGSMSSPDKLELLQDSFTELTKHLDKNDRISIVTYSGKEEVVIEGVPGDDSATIMKAIYKLHASGSTNGEAGLRMAYDVAERNYIEGGVNRVIMASDGDLNVGMTSESDLYSFVDGKRDTGVYLSVLGFGSGNYKDTKMEVLADHGNGSYHYIDCIEEAERVFSERLMANLVPFADNVKMQIEFNPSQVKGYRLIGYENRALEDSAFRNDAVDAGDIGPDAQFTVAYEVVLADSPFEIDTPELTYGEQPSNTGSPDWLTCSLRYRAFSDNEMHEQSITVDSANSVSAPSKDWRFAAAVIEFGMLARNSKYRGDTSIDSVLALLDGTTTDADREGFLRLVEKAR